MVPFGTDETISRVVEAYSPMLLRLAAARLQSAADAEDAVQEAFLRLLTAAPVFRDAEHEKAWLIRTTLHRASDLRRQAERRNVPLEDVSESAGEETADRGRAVREAVQALPEKYASVIHLYYYEGYSMKEIARLLGLPAPTVGTRLARGRERLRQMLKEECL
ncbi:RNA polymerase sigma factor [uncultured Oscillibacter sp.]|uniref:RNA polymerase sigma factor n=1 Tax=uncultured Oscillibacter sp. TaxID=876091 RepID=UPI00262448BD|nr:RNA polymerase sigma factor [uncultured Oscillibacter sp.]